MAITKVEYFNGSTKIGERIEEPFDQFTWTNAPSGNHSITAKLYEDGNLVDTSSAVSITVNEQSSGGGGDFDPDFQAVLDYATAESIPLPDATEQENINQWIIDRKASGDYQKDDVILKADGTAPEEFKLICLKRKVKMDKIGTVTFNNDGVSVEVGGAINSKYKPATDAVNLSISSLGVDYEIHSEDTIAGKIILGVRDSSTTYFDIFPRFSSSAGGSARLGIATPTEAGFPLDKENLKQSMNKQNGEFTFNNGVDTPVTISQSEPDDNTLSIYDLYLMATHRGTDGEGTVDASFFGSTIKYIALGGSKL